MSNRTFAAVVSAVTLVCGSPAHARIRAEHPGRAQSAKPPDNEDQQRHRIILPPGFSPDNRLTPVVYALHGYGGNMEAMEHVWREPCSQAGAILVVGRGSKVVGPGAYSWESFEDAGKMIQAARAGLRDIFKPSRFAPRVLTGISQGAWATYALADRYAKTYRRLIPVVGMFRAKSHEITKPLTDKEKAVMKRWHVYMMVGIKDESVLVANNGWLASRLEELGAAVKAPFTDKGDPSYPMYQQLGHAFPGRGAERTAELLRALKFVLRPDKQDRKNWSKVDPHWRKKAKWIDDKSPLERPNKADRPKRRKGARKKPPRD